MIAGRVLDEWADTFDVGDDDSGSSVPLELMRMVAEAIDLLQTVAKRMADGPGDSPTLVRWAITDCESVADELAAVRGGFASHVRGGR